MLNLRWVLMLGCCALAVGSHIAAAQNDADPVEIIIEGQHYGSFLEYKREKIKKILERALSSVNLQEFSDKEICEILIELRKKQTSPSTSIKAQKLKNPQINRNDEPKLNPDHVQDRLDQSDDERRGDAPFEIDPDQVKNGIVEPFDKFGSKPDDLTDIKASGTSSISLDLD